MQPLPVLSTCGSILPIAISAFAVFMSKTWTEDFPLKA